MSKKILIKNIIVCCPIQKIYERLDILISNGKIQEIKKDISFKNPSLKIDGYSKRFLFSSLVDIHSYALRDLKYNEKNKSQIESAISGGFSLLNISPYITNLYQKNSFPSIYDYKLFSSQSPISILFPLRLDDIHKIPHELSTHPFIDTNNHLLIDDLLCFSNYAFTHKKKLSIFPRNNINFEQYQIPQGKASFTLGLPSYDPLIENILLSQYILLSKLKSIQVHFKYISQIHSLKTIFKYKRKIKKSLISTNIAFHQLIFSEEDLIQSNYHSFLKFRIPLLESEIQKRYILELKKNIIDTISSEDTPCYNIEKEKPFIEASCGIINLEVFFSILYQRLVQKKYLSLMELLEKISSNPRKILKQDPLIIKKGYPATFCIFDDSFKWIPKISFFKNSPWTQKTIEGAILYNIYKGKVLFHRNT